MLKRYQPLAPSNLRPGVRTPIRGAGWGSIPAERRGPSARGRHRRRGVPPRCRCTAAQGGTRGACGRQLRNSPLSAQFAATLPRSPRARPPRRPPRRACRRVGRPRLPGTTPRRRRRSHGRVAHVSTTGLQAGEGEIGAPRIAGTAPRHRRLGAGRSRAPGNRARGTGPPCRRFAGGVVHRLACDPVAPVRFHHDDQACLPTR